MGISRKKQNYLIFVCWLMYLVAQLGRYSYSSNVTLIMERYGVNHADAGLPTTFYFFAYGFGQIVNGFLCKKYNKRYVLTFALLLSAGLNFALFFGVTFAAVKYLWLLNGIVQSTLWASLILTISCNIDDERLAGASLVMSTATTGGTFLVYGASALFSAFGHFEWIFLTSTVGLVVGGVLWFFGSRTLNFQTISADSQNASAKNAAVPFADKSRRDKVRLAVLICLFAEFAMIGFAISGGLRSWIPSILKETYGLSDWLSIFLTLFLPFCSVFTASVSVFLHKKLKNFVLTTALMFGLGAILILGVIVYLKTSWILVLVLFILVSMSMGVISNQMTVQAPLYMKRECGAGFLAGLLNGFCYVGSALSTYGFGIIADHSGWSGVFNLLLILACVSAALAVFYLLIVRISHIRSEKNKKMEI